MLAAVPSDRELVATKDDNIYSMSDTEITSG